MDSAGEKKLLDRKKTLEIFDYLNERLKENQLHLEITVYGGAIMTMLYDNRPATKDIDCVFNQVNEGLLKNILEMARFTFGLPENWINDQIKEPLKALLKEDLETYRTYSNLIIHKPRAEQLLAMKILAARPEPAKDFVDAAILCLELRINSKDDLLNIFAKYLPLSLLGERQIRFIKYLGDDLGHDWQ